MDSKTTRPDTPWYRSVVEPMRSDPDRIARFYDRLLTMKSNELAGELETIRGSFEKDKSELSRLQLALLLSFPGTTFRDDIAALALLNPFIKEKGREGSTLRPLAIWLHSELLLRRTDEVLQQQAAKLKEELRRTDEALQQQAAKLKEEQRRAEALQQKLEAILDMEKKMIEREQNLLKK